MGREAGEWLVNESFVRSNVGKTNAMCTIPSHHHLFIGGICFYHSQSWGLTTTLFYPLYIYINPIKKSPFLLVKSIEPPFFIVKSHEIHHCFYHSQSWQPQFMMPKSPDSGWYKKLISTRVECPKGSWEMMVKNGLVSENCRIRYHNINHWFCDI